MQTSCLSLALALALAAPAALAECKTDKDFGFNHDKTEFCCGKAGNDPATEHALFEKAKIFCNQGCVSSFVIEKKKKEWKDHDKIEVRMYPAKSGGKNADAEYIIDNHHALWTACALGKPIKPIGLNKLKMPSNFEGGCKNTKKLEGDGDTLSLFNKCLGLPPPEEKKEKPDNAGTGPNACLTSADCADHPNKWTKCCPGTKGVNYCKSANYSPCKAL